MRGGDAYRILEGKSEVDRPHMWEDNIEMNLREIGWRGMNWIDLAEDRDQLRALVNAVMNFWVP
jgi:hypothetical protein